MVLPTQAEQANFAAQIGAEWCGAKYFLTPHGRSLHDLTPIKTDGAGHVGQNHDHRIQPY